LPRVVARRWRWACNAPEQLLAGNASRQRWLWLLTDGRSSESPARPQAADVACVVDFEAARLPLHRAQRLAAQWDARYLAV
jgi:magnesium chelatase subunit ChlD-like protein